MSQNPAPKEVFEFVARGCRSTKSCSTGMCPCVKNGLPCTDCCDCGAAQCQNDIQPTVGSNEPAGNDGWHEDEAVNSPDGSGDELPE